MKLNTGFSPAAFFPLCVIAVLALACTPPTDPDAAGTEQTGENPGGENPGEENPAGENPGEENPSETEPLPPGLTLVSIEITSPPAKTAYAKGEAFDPWGLVVTARYSDGTTRGEQDYSLENTATDTEGDKTITVKFRDKSVSFTITVGPPVLASIEIVSPPDKLFYAKGEQFVQAGLEVRAVYTDGESLPLPAGDLRLTGNGTRTAGEKTVTVTYREKTASFTIVVSEGIMTGIALASSPNKTVYDLYEELDLAGIIVTGSFTDISSPVRLSGITAGMVSGYDRASPGEQTLTLRYPYGDGFFSVTFTVRIRKPELYFDTGRRRAGAEGPDTASYTAPQGRALILVPVGVGVSPGAPYSWTVDGVPAGTGPSFSLTPDAADRVYLVRVSAPGAEATVTVRAAPPEGVYKRVNPAARARASSCFEFTPAPGQFVTIGQGDTEEAVRAAAQATLEGLSSDSADGYAWSLGAWGGYIVFGFDHSVENLAGNDLVIHGNPLQGWSEPGVVWVSQDDNGNGLPDDTWYELAGSEAGKTALRGYSVTYYKASGDKGPVWKDNQGNSGFFPAKNYYGNPQGYPWSVPGEWVTFTGTLLNSQIREGEIITNTGFAWGYVDNEFGGPYFDIANAVQADGSPINLDYLDFVKVQTGVNGYGGELGELSTETGAPYDYHPQ